MCNWGWGGADTPLAEKVRQIVFDQVPNLTKSPAERAAKSRRRGAREVGAALSGREQEFGQYHLQ